MFNLSAVLRAGIAPESFAALGANRIAYVKPVRTEDVAHLYPGAPVPTFGEHIFVLHAADGTPMVLADTRESAVATAASQNLEAVSVH